MIERLSIDNYALIDQSIIDWDKGFTVITGETGAGKSIMLDALALLMGNRADNKAIGNKDKKMVVEAFFVTDDEKVKNILEDNSIDIEDGNIIVRREITPAGKSRSFVNDTPVNLAVLSLLSQRLIDIHSQHKNSLLISPSQQLSIIDSYGGLENIVADYRHTFKEYVGLRNRIKKIKESRASGKENREFILFRLEQLNKLKPRNGELESLEKEADLLGDADNIKSDLTEAYQLLGGGSASALKLLQSVSSILEHLDLGALQDEDENLGDRLSSVRIELRDISDTIETLSDKIVSDPERLEKVRKRIDSLYEAIKHFKVKDEAELVALHNHLKEELNLLEENTEDETQLEVSLKELAKILKEKADALTAERTKFADLFSKEIENKIKPLGMPNVKFHIKIERGKLTSEGQDILTFYCSFNKNHPLQPISEIASGGEISRVMLGIKSIMAKKMQMPTVIFDEIDTGVSGEIAHKMGIMMKEMSDTMQVISVTHLPQVAAAGDSHLKVYKADDQEKTISRVRSLNKEDRIREIAGMLSGNSINEVALENARLLLNSN